jgi:ribosomal protein S18 acetylase RimI-like enzyme
MSDDFYIVDTLTEEQINQLLEMYRNEWWSKERAVEDVKLMLKNSNIIAFINKNSKEIIGFARFLSDCIYRATIYDVMISKNYRALGYGRILLETLLGHKYLKDIERVELCCRDQMVPFYEKFNFRKVSEGTNFMRRTPIRE